MFRGRKRKLPTTFIPEPYYHGSESGEDSDDQHQNWLSLDPRHRPKLVQGCPRSSDLPHEVPEEQEREDTDDPEEEETVGDGYQVHEAQQHTHGNDSLLQVDNR